MSNCKFIPTRYIPSEQEKSRLQELQNQLGIIHAELAYIVREDTEYFKWLRKESFRHKFRENIKLVEKNKPY